MKRFLTPAIFMVLILAIFIGSVLAQDGQPSSPKLPPGFIALVPQGYELQSPEIYALSTAGGIEFIASKQFEGRHSVQASEYHLELTIMENLQVLIQRQVPVYRQQLEQDSQSALNRRNNVKSPGASYDKPQLSKYPWGTGITQRVVHSFIGFGKQPDEIEYQCEYFGLITSTGAIKKYKLSVYGVENREVADKWAIKVAEQVEKTTISNLAVK